MSHSARHHKNRALVGVGVLDDRSFPYPTTQKQQSSRRTKLQGLGIEAYIYGYPLVTAEMTRRVVTNVEKPEGAHAPMGQFANLRRYPDATFKEVTAPNADTL